MTDFDDGRVAVGGKPAVLKAGLAIGPNFADLFRDSARKLNTRFDPLLTVGARYVLTQNVEIGGSCWWTSFVPVFPVLLFQSGDLGASADIKWQWPLAHDQRGDPATWLTLKAFGSAYGAIRADVETRKANGYVLAWGPALTLGHQFTRRISEECMPPEMPCWQEVGVVYLGARLHVFRSRWEYGLDGDATHPAVATDTVSYSGYALNPFVGYAITGSPGVVFEASGFMARNPHTDQWQYGGYVGVALRY